MKKVYVVTSWEYSNYWINAMFSTKKKAQEYIDLFSDLKNWYNKANIEVRDIDVMWDKKWMKPYFVRVTKDWLISEWNIANSDYWFDKPNHWIWIDIHWSMYVHIFARNEEEARKSAIDISRANYHLYK